MPSTRARICRSFSIAERGGGPPAWRWGPDRPGTPRHFLGRPEDGGLLGTGRRSARLAPGPGPGRAPPPAGTATPRWW